MVFFFFLSVVHYKEKAIAKHGRHRYHFDLTRIPEEETVTAAELRVFRYNTNQSPGNGTYRINIYQVLPPDQERGRYLKPWVSQP